MRSAPHRCTAPPDSTTASPIHPPVPAEQRATSSSSMPEMACAPPFKPNAVACCSSTQVNNPPKITKILNPSSYLSCQHSNNPPSHLNPSATPFTPANMRPTAATTPVFSLPTIANTNLRSLCSKIGLYAQFLDDYAPNIAFISETWLTQDNKDTTLASLFASIDHKLFFVHSIRCGRGGGTLILIRQDYAPSIVELQPKPIESKPWHTDEGKAKLGNLELCIARCRPPKLPFGYSCCLLVCCYVAEFCQDGKVTARQPSSINQLIYAIEDAVSDSTGTN